jgi:hypothetical protein
VSCDTVSVLLSCVPHAGWLKEIRFCVGFFAAYSMFVGLPILRASSWPCEASLCRFLEIVV